MMPRLTFSANRHPIQKLYSKMERGFMRSRAEVLVFMAGYTDITKLGGDSGAMSSELK